MISQGVLADLFNTLLLNNINPYYLHHPDLAKGTGHFYLNLEEGAKIYNETAKMISGLALPKYVIDIPGGFGKIPVNSGQVVKTDGGFILIDNNGRRHKYLFYSRKIRVLNPQSNHPHLQARLNNELMRFCCSI